MLRRLLERARVPIARMPDEMAQAVPVPATSSSAVKAEGVNALVGWSFEETSETLGAKIRLRDGTITGTVIATIPLLPGEGVNHSYPTALMVPSRKLFVEVVSGSVEGSLHRL